ncbi:Ferritin-1, chloroplastic [Tetrabaena socialis]|uniref:Ferritin-1, chloroplastic n=1 Tax=Tetrabaena socialis TaxID=47790 RepID=A0A2J8AK36_9CHLO|nr:Ferritin-1, chloroplastic [Tetrabaena socialis]|eukprot:PNH12886.1 Ferritin-1, chloroplastic [Tetrabaena socialis]
MASAALLRPGSGLALHRGAASPAARRAGGGCVPLLRPPRAAEGTDPVVERLHAWIWSTLANTQTHPTRAAPPAEKGDALHATELALSLEKLNFAKLREVHSLATGVEDADATHFLEDHLLHEQSKDVKEAAVLVAQVRRAGRGHGVFHVDTLLASRYGAAGALAG